MTVRVELNLFAALFCFCAPGVSVAHNDVSKRTITTFPFPIITSVLCVKNFVSSVRP